MGDCLEGDLAIGEDGLLGAVNDVEQVDDIGATELIVVLDVLRLGDPQDGIGADNREERGGARQVTAFQPFERQSGAAHGQALGVAAKQGCEQVHKRGS
jgi:hypothetical protein